MADSGLRMTQPGEAVPFEIPGGTGQFKIQILNEDRDKGVVTSIVHLPAGGVIPAHYHDAGSEMHYVLEGDLIEAGETLAVGAFLTHARGVVHGPHESKGGAKVLTVQTWQSEGGSFDFRPAEGGGAQTGGSQAGSSQAGSSQAGSSQAGSSQAGGSQPGASSGSQSGSQSGSSGAAQPANAGAETQEEAAQDHRNKGYS